MCNLSRFFMSDIILECKILETPYLFSFSCLLWNTVSNSQSDFEVFIVLI